MGRTNTNLTLVMRHVTVALMAVSMLVACDSTGTTPGIGDGDATSSDNAADSSTLPGDVSWIRSRGRKGVGSKGSHAGTIGPGKR